MDRTDEYLDEALSLARRNLAEGGRPFGAVLVRNGQVIARGVNRMLALNDPTAHAEIEALRAGGKALGSPRLEGCAVYASGQPCPMCMAAMRMAGISEIAFIFSNEEAEPYGLSTAGVAREVARPLAGQAWAIIRHRPRPRAVCEEVYGGWTARQAG